MCPRHRVPSLSSHRQLSTSSLTKWHNVTKHHHHKRTRSHLSNTSAGTSNDYNQLESNSNSSRRRRFQNVKSKKLEIIKSSSAGSFLKMRTISHQLTSEECQMNKQIDSNNFSNIKESSSNKVKFDLNETANFNLIDVSSNIGFSSL